MSAPNLAVNIAGIRMKNPLTVGSGTYGHHGNFNQFFPVNILARWCRNHPRLQLARQSRRACSDACLNSQLGRHSGDRLG